MTILAWIVVAGIVLRLLLVIFDTGFGGPVWTWIYYVSTVTLTAAFFLALAVLGVRIDIGIQS